MGSRVRRSVVCVVIAFLVHAPSDAQLRAWKGRAQDDVAAVHVAVQSVAPFEIYVESLQPTFTLTTQQALDYAIAQTRTRGTATMRALQAVVSANVGGTVSAPAPAPAPPAAPAPAASGAATQQDNATEDAAPPAATNTADVEESDSETESDNSLPPSIKRTLQSNLPSGEVSFDPFVHHSAAAALLQYVALLNNYVRDAAVQSGARPYVVRLLVTVLPTASTRGYDAYSTISFFTDPGPMKEDGRFAATGYALDAAARGERGAAMLHQLQQEIDALAYDPKIDPATARAKINLRRSEMQTWQPDISDASLLGRARALGDCEAKPLQVVPLLVTDNIESSMHRDSVEYVRNLAIALQSAGKRTRATAGFRSQLNDIAETLTRNLNSLMTVGQIGTNSIRVRLGASYGNRSDVMIPRTYSVTALVLMPTAETAVGTEYPNNRIGTEILPCSIAAFTAHSEFRNTRNGKLARTVTFRDLTYAIQDMINVNPDTAAALAEAALADNYDDFAASAIPLRLTTSQKMELWPRLQNLVARTSISRGRFQAPLRDSSFFSSLVYASVIDNGTDSRVTLQGGANLVAERIVGTLLVKVKSGDLGQQEKDLYLPAGRIDVSSDRRSATLIFPSLDGLVKAENVKSVFAEVRYLPGVRNWQDAAAERHRIWYLQDVHRADANTNFRLGANYQEVPLSYYGPLKPKPAEKPDSSKPQFTVTTGVDTVTARKGEGHVTLWFKHEKPEGKFDIFFDVTAADLVRVSPEAKQDAGQWSITADNRYRLDLENLVPNTDVKVTTWRLANDAEKKGDAEKNKIEGPTLTFKVIETEKEQK